MKAQITNLLLAGFSVVALGGCLNTIEGTLSVDKTFTGKSVQKLPCSPEAGDPCYSEKTIQVNPGQYASKISFNTRTEVEVQIKGAKTETLKVQVPSNLNIPENGSFVVTSRQSGQPFDMNGVMATTYQNSQPYRTRETCTVERWEQECWVTPQGRQCQNVLRTYPGWRDVEFYYLDVLQNLEVALTSASDRSHLAVFKGQKQTSEKRYTYQGYCW